MFVDSINPNYPPLVALDTMIQWTLKVQTLNSDLKQQLDYISWLKEFCTIKFSLPRRSGHTVSGRYIVNKYFNNPIFFVLNKQLKRLEKDYTFEDLKSNKLIDKKFNTSCFVIDTASFMSKTLKDEIYYFFPINGSEQKLILFLQ